MKQLVISILICLCMNSYAQTAPSDKGISINAGIKLLEMTQGNLPAVELKLIRFNRSALLSPYISLAAGKTAYSEDGKFDISSRALSVKGGGLLRLSMMNDADKAVFLRAGLGYIVRKENLDIDFENKNWGNDQLSYQQQSGKWFMDLGVRTEFGITPNLTFNIDVAGYVIGGHVNEKPFANEITYREKINFYYPNPGLGPGTGYGFNLTLGLGFLIR